MGASVAEKLLLFFLKMCSLKLSFQDEDQLYGKFLFRILIASLFNINIFLSSS